MKRKNSYIYRDFPHIAQVRALARYLGARIAVQWRGQRCISYTLPLLDTLPIRAFHVYRGPILGSILRTADDREVGHIVRQV